MKTKQKVLELIELQDSLIVSTSRGMEHNMLTAIQVIQKLNHIKKLTNEIKKFINLERN